MPNEQAKILTLVFTDLADSTALKTAHGDQAVDGLLTRHRDHVVRLADACSGRVIDWAGDGCFLTFDTSSAAVMFALRLQQAHADETDLPEVRIGVHLGEVTEKPGPDNTTYVKGLAVDLAARIQSLAKPGQVLLSAAVYDSARQRIGVDALGQPVLWQTHGAYTLKGFDKPLDIGEAGLEGMSPLIAPEASEKARPVASTKPETPLKHHSPVPSRRYTAPILAGLIVFVIAAAAYILGQTSDTPISRDTPITSLAVLPLDNLMNDDDQAYFTDGMTEAITAELAKIESLKVISRTSVMQYKGTIKTMPEIAAELGVEGLVEGSVLRDGNEVRITVQLIDGRTDVHLWSQSYTNTLTSVLQLQAEVALAIAEAVEAEVTGDERTRIDTAYQVDPEAHDAYLRGRFFWNQRSPASLRRAIDYFEQAKGIDPQYAPAYAGAADCYIILQAYGLMDPTIAVPRAQAEARRALELDPALTEAMATMALIAYNYDWDLERAEHEFERVIELDPNNATAHVWYAFSLSSMRRFEEALELQDRAAALDPLSLLVPATRGYFLHLSGDAAASDRILDETSQIDPNYLPLLFFRVLSFSDGGDLNDLDAAIERFRGLDSRAGISTVLRSLSLAAHGEVEEARTALEEAEVLRENEYFQDFFGITVCLLLDDLDAAYTWLARAVETHDWFIQSSWANPRFRQLWKDPRFLPFARELGFDKLDGWVEPKVDTPIEKIAVLPFDNMSSDPEQEYFVDGMTEALIAELAKVKSIKVISRTSVMQYKDTDKSLPEIARELNVDALVEGSVMKADNDVRITAQLVHGITDEHLWAESYTNTLDNVFQVQAEVALAIVDEINAVVTTDERTRIASRKTVDARAYQLYVQGRAFWSQRTEVGLRTARRMFEQALEIDPDFALGHAGLSDAFFMLSDYGVLPFSEAYPRARAEVELALALDPLLGEAYITRAGLREAIEWDWEDAEADYRRGIELSPGHATGLQWYAITMRSTGRLDESLDMIKRAQELDPASPVVAQNLAQGYCYVGDFTAGIAEIEKLLQLFPDNPRVHDNAAYVYDWAGRLDDALEAARHAVSLTDGGGLETVTLARLTAKTGDFDAARHLLEPLLADPASVVFQAVQIATCLVALDQVDSAIDWLERAFEQRSSSELASIGILPELEPIRDDPRFQEVLRRMNHPLAKEVAN